jgi:hypothetical protein
MKASPFFKSFEGTVYSTDTRNKKVKRGAGRWHCILKTVIVAV